MRQPRMLPTLRPFPRPLFLLIVLTANVTLQPLTTSACQSTPATSSSSPHSDQSPSIWLADRVIPIEIRLTQENWDALAPKSNQNPFSIPNPNHRPGSFGYEFDYVRATLTIDGHRLDDVGLRFKGNGTFMASQQRANKPFKVDFDRYHEKTEFQGMRQLNLHNDVLDPSHLRQNLAYEVFAIAGVPSPRTTLGQLTLHRTHSGDSQQSSPLGIYTLVEEVDKRFLQDRFGNAQGLLLKPEGTQGIEYKGDDWDAYDWYEPKTKVRPKEAKRFIAFARSIYHDDDATFQRLIGSYLDLENFANFLAANVLLANMDSFLTNVHNYFVYLPGNDAPILFLPWDMDLAFGAFFFVGSPEQLADLSIDHPYVGDNRLLQRLLAWDTFRSQYHERLRALSDLCFAPEGKTHQSMKRWQNLLQQEAHPKPRTDSPPKAPPGFPGPPWASGSETSLQSFMERRLLSIQSQLAGESSGRVPQMPSFGPRPSP